MATITLIDSLPTADEGGVWTYTGTTAPNPAAPGTWGGSVDFTGYDNGLYEYTYTVTPTCGTPTSKTVTVNLNNQLPLSNDLCAGGESKSGLLSDTGDNSYSFANENMAGSCGTNPLVAATLSAESIPGSWGGSYSADMWYLLSVEILGTSSEFLSITTNSGAYPTTERLTNAALAIYDGTCGSLSLVASTPAQTSQITKLGVTLTPGTYRYYVRVGGGGTIGNTGKFTIAFNLT